MINWTSPAEIAHDGAAFSNLMHVLFGLYVWEWFTSLGFDWSFISMRKQFRWPLIFYFGGRYCLLMALIGILVALNVNQEIDCQALYTFNATFGSAAIGFASINLTLRTMAVWSQKWYIVVPLTAMLLGHWSLLLHGILLKATWLPGAGCIITGTNDKILEATFIYTMVLDLTVLLLTAWKLFSPGTQRSPLMKLIFNDGLNFFIICFTANLLAMIFILLNLNSVMSIIANVPAAICSTIVACRAVRRLSEFADRPPRSYGGSTLTSTGVTMAFRKYPTTKDMVASATEGIHVQMETLPSQGSSLQLDAGKTGEVDIESQQLSSEFKRPPYI